jgi:hypothetical protein
MELLVDHLVVHSKEMELYRVANSSNNRILTSVDARNGNAEANLTFDGYRIICNWKSN